MAIIGGIPHFQTYPYNETALGYFFEIQMLLFGCVLDQGYLFWMVINHQFCKVYLSIVHGIIQRTLNKIGRCLIFRPIHLNEYNGAAVSWYQGWVLRRYVYPWFLILGSNGERRRQILQYGNSEVYCYILRTERFGFLGFHVVWPETLMGPTRSQYC